MLMLMIRVKNRVMFRALAGVGVRTRDKVGLIVMRVSARVGVRTTDKVGLRVMRASARVG